MKGNIYILIKMIALLSITFALIGCKKEDGQSHKEQPDLVATIYPEPITESTTPLNPTSESKNEPTTTQISNEGIQVLVYKGNRKLELYQDCDLIGEYNIGLGFTPEGHKQVEGDGKTPEGIYYVCTKNDQSRFYLSLGLSYPSIPDATRGLQEGIISHQEHDSIVTAINSKRMPLWNTSLGGEIMIHGHGSQSDWTHGCIAVDDEVMDVLWQYCQNGTSVTIYP